MGEKRNIGERIKDEDSLTRLTRWSLLDKFQIYICKCTYMYVFRFVFGLLLDDDARARSS